MPNRLFRPCSHPGCGALVAVLCSWPRSLACVVPSDAARTAATSSAHARLHVTREDGSQCILLRSPCMRYSRGTPHVIGGVAPARAMRSGDQGLVRTSLSDPLP